MTGGRFFARVAALAVAFTVSLVAARSARADELDDELASFKSSMLAELEATSADAAKEIAAGDEVAVKDIGAALEHYEAAAKLAPTSPHPLRRLCNAEVQFDRRADAITHCRAARALRDDDVQRGALGRALIAPPATPPEQDEGYALILGAAKKTNSVADLFALCEAALQLERKGDLTTCSQGLETKAPSSPGTWVFVALREATAERFTEAKAAMVKARKLGLVGLEDLEKKIDENLPFTTRFRWLFVFLAAWAGMVIFVSLMGLLLSAITRSAAYRLPETRTGHAHGATSALRSTYRAVLWLASALFYASIPVMLLSVVGAAGGLVYLSLLLGRIPVKLLLIVILVACLTIWATLKSLFVRVKQEDPGPKLDLPKHPKLDAVLGEVAGAVGTRRVDTVFFTGNTDLAVFERGGVLARLRGARSERCLVIGAGVLKGMRQIELKAILAHEYGHFQNEDTAGGGFALAVRRSATMLVIGLARGGAAAWYNPAWWMARAFYALFLRISQGASRLQEILADRWAAFAYGKDAFEAGLRHVIARDVEFHRLADHAVEGALKETRAIKNLYRLRANDAEIVKRIDDDVTTALERPASPYDSHPAPAERFELVRRLDAPTPEGEDTEALAWDLFDDRKSLEREHTAALLGRLQDRLGVRHLVATGAAQTTSDAD